MRTEYRDPTTNEPINFDVLSFDDLRDLKYRTAEKASRLCRDLDNMRAKFRQTKKPDPRYSRLRAAYAHTCCLISRIKQEFVLRSRTPGRDNQPAQNYERTIARLKQEIALLQQQLETGNLAVQQLEEIVEEHTNPQTFRRIMTQFEELRSAIAQPDSRVLEMQKTSKLEAV